MCILHIYTRAYVNALIIQKRKKNKKKKSSEYPHCVIIIRVISLYNIELDQTYKFKFLD